MSVVLNSFHSYFMPAVHSRTSCNNEVMLIVKLIYIFFYQSFTLFSRMS